MTIKQIIKQAIDIHVHIGPEIIPRKYTVAELVKTEKDKLGGAVLKNHFYPSSPLIKETTSDSLKLFGGVVLNNFVGGLNPEAIYSASLLSDNPIMVWFPTLNAKNFLDKSDFEIAPEWVNNKNFKGRSSREVKPVVIEEPQLSLVLKTIEETGAVLATGHLSWQESVELVNKAREIGIKKIVVTHPIYQRINMPIDIQKQLASEGVFIEQSYSMYSIDKISIDAIASQIKAIGAQSVILSSDVGQPFSLSPSQALTNFAQLLNNEGLTKKQLYQMLVTNPKKLLGIDKKPGVKYDRK